MSRLVRGLGERGWTPAVLTVGKAAMVRSRGLDDPLAGEPDRVLRYDDPLAAVAANASENTADSRRKGLGGMLKAFAKGLLFPDRTVLWAMRLRAAHSEPLVAKAQVILSTSPSLASHIAAYRIARKTGAAWVAEFRDPVSWLPEKDETGPVRRRLLARLERWIVGRADATVTMSDTFTEYFKGLYPDAEIRAVPNGSDFDPDAIQAKMKAREARLAAADPDTPLILLHAGALYGGAREPGPIIQAAKKAALQTTRPIRLKFIGSDSYLAAEEASRLDATDIVEAVPALDHAATVRETEQADAVLAMLHRDPVGRVSIMSKFFDYIATGTPILVVGERCATLSKIVEQEGAGAAREYDDVEGMTQWIVRLEREPQTMSYDAVAASGNWSADRMAERMSLVFQHVLGR